MVADMRACSTSIRITEADTERGVPNRAQCGCGWTWQRPADDRWADTLPVEARAHRAQS
jgi:hypothetical protein